MRLTTLITALTAALLSFAPAQAGGKHTYQGDFIQKHGSGGYEGDFVPGQGGKITGDWVQKGSGGQITGDFVPNGSNGRITGDFQPEFSYGPDGSGDYQQQPSYNDDLSVGDYQPEDTGPDARGCLPGDTIVVGCGPEQQSYDNHYDEQEFDENDFPPAPVSHL